VKPHRLQLSAFGAFAGTVEIDLDRLAGSGLFLLHGPTGAGKSTLLDGLGFALFGKVPGTRNAVKRLRSDHATADTPTQVQLEVSFGARRLRITRSPDYERPKKRGAGTTTEKAKVLLEERVGDEWVFRSDRFDEAGLEIADLVGMNADQFFQVVLLPQGDFAQFLKASSTDRAALLQKLFNTERFAAVEDWLVQRRRAADRAVHDARAGVDQVLARLAEVIGQEVPEDDVLGWVQQAGAAIETADEVAAQAVAAATLTRDDARRLLDEATALADRQRRKQSALTRREELEIERPALLALRTELDAAARAAEVAGAVAESTDRRTARDEALAHEARVRAGLAAAGLAVDLTATELAGQIAQGRAREGRLTALRAVATSWELERAAVMHAVEEQADARTALAEGERRLAELPTRRAQALLAVQAGRAAAERLPAVQAEQDVLRALRPDVVALVQLETVLTDRVHAHLAARQTHVSLLEKANDLRTASINTMVARLAFALESDTPCPVCGSCEHPDPSALRDEGVTSEDEDAARQAADEAQHRVAELEALLAADRAKAEALRSRVGAWTPAGIEAELAEADLELGLLRTQVAQGQQAEQVVAAIDAEQQEATASLVAGESAVAAAERRQREAQARADAAAAQLGAELAGSTDLDEALAQVAAQIFAAEQAHQATEALTRAQLELDRSLDSLAEACAARGFATAGEAIEAARTDEWRAQVAGRLEAAAAEEAAVLSALADPALDIPLDPPAPLAERGQALAEADEVLGAAVAEQAQTRQRRSALERLVPALDSQLAALVPLQETAARVRRLAEVCAGQGQNTLRMTLTSFVLAARLEEVAAAASVRLRRMTQGRYELVHTDGASRGGAKSGLGLLARDAWTGRDRETGTLSGGETFLASLALALGLADVVTAEAGGTRIEALFVDEGFGTLDEQTLDEVMDVLDGLREGGRLVGLVSHVAELRQRIPAQVEVLKTRTGSSLTLHGC
jgi:exonuclease SbcC